MKVEMKQNHMAVVIGQTVYVAGISKRDGPGKIATVARIGNKWVYLDTPGYVSERFNLATGWMDGRGYTSTRRVWPSREAWETAVSTDEEWNRLKVRITYKAPEGVTLADIRQAARLLRQD
jgi:hypothetical protein